MKTKTLHRPFFPRWSAARYRPTLCWVNVFGADSCVAIYRERRAMPELGGGSETVITGCDHRDLMGKSMSERQGKG